MIEPIMFFSLGFLVATAVALVALPAVWNRAVRLTRRRIETLVPVSMAEIQADKDQLRAEFALSARRLEINLDNLKRKTTEQLTELTKRQDSIIKLKSELSEKDAALQAIEAQEKALRDQLVTTEEELSAKTRALRDAESQLGERATALAALQKAVDEKAMLSDSQRVEIIALETQIAGLKERVGELEKEVETTAARARRERDNADSLNRTLVDERAKMVVHASQVTELEAKLANQTREGEAAARRIASLENELRLQDERLRTHDDAVTSARRDASDARLAEQRAREDIERARKAVDGETRELKGTIDALKAEKTKLDTALAQAREDRAKLQREVAQLKRQTESNWASERTENALLRERINDVAAEVARLTAQLEGPGSPIHALLDDAGKANGAPITTPRRDPAAAPALPHAETRSLAERIKALQARASRT